VAELSDPKRERFVRLRALGMSLRRAHREAGWAGDRANASKIEAEPATRARIEELKAAAAAKSEAAEFSGQALTREAVEMARAQKNPVALRQLAEFIDSHDESMASLRPTAAEAMTLGQILALARRLDPGLDLWFNVCILLLLVDPKTGKPTPPWKDGAGNDLPPYLRPDGGLVEA